MDSRVGSEQAQEHGFGIGGARHGTGEPEGVGIRLKEWFVHH